MVNILRDGLQALAVVVILGNVQLGDSFAPISSRCCPNLDGKSRQGIETISQSLAVRHPRAGLRQLAMRKGPPKKAKQGFAKTTKEGFSHTTSDSVERKAGTPAPDHPERRNSDAADKTLDRLKLAANNLFLICAQIQNPELYSASWTDNACIASDSGMGLVAARDVEEGEILSLYPIHALGIHSLGSGETRKEFMVFDADRDADYFTAAPRDAKRQKTSLQTAAHDAKGHRCDVPLLDESNLFHRTLGGLHDGIFLGANPSRAANTGWLAHLCSEVGSASDVPEAGGRKEGEEEGRKEEGGGGVNAILVPLVGAEPFTALVALAPITKGQALLAAGTDSDAAKVVPKMAERTAARYQSEIAELRSYLAQAYPEEAQEAAKSDRPRGRNNVQFRGDFHAIDRSYPGVQVLHTDPDILVVPNFLTEEECERLIRKATPHMVPCLTKNPRTGAVERDPARTSSNANLPQLEIPSVVEKLQKLTQCEATQLETLQVLRYRRGQEFQAHTDGFQGPVTACGYTNSGRIVTAFCYLNDVERGGETRFPLLDLSIQPKKGMAVVHFPATLELEEDERTEHAGQMAEEEKWVIATWVWKHGRSDARYAEENLPRLSDDVI